MTDMLRRRESLRALRTPYIVATVVRAERPTSAKAGDNALVLPDGTIEGFVGGTCAESTVRAQGLRALDTGEATLLRITPSADATETRAEGVIMVNNPCLSGGALDIFLEPVLPPTPLRVLGDGPIARALVRFGGELGYDVDNPADPDTPLPAHTGVVVVASHGRDEEPVLTAALRAEVDYVGLIASRRRGAAVLAGLDVAEEQRARVRTPAGLDIGARGATEIALSVFAEIIALRPRRENATASAGGGLTPGEAVDPVCGMTVVVTERTPSVRAEGTAFYFCGTGCKQAYRAEPTKYAPA